ncbi:MAG TPA: hypothetical protein VEZ41_13780 [Allosphingosinicella sp.]|jgi:hypothetical protein|nr:hypothetical protein [Allosphingosinicella sp.]
MLHLILAVAAQEVTVTVREPVPAVPWTETFTGRCGREELQVTRPIYSRRNPAPQPRPAIRINGRAAGGNIGPTLAELGTIGASYRFSFLCAQQGGAIYLRWVRGLADGRGQVSYRSGRATFRNGALVEAAAEDSNEEAFWYR